MTDYTASTLAQVTTHLNSSVNAAGGDRVRLTSGVTGHLVIRNEFTGFTELIPDDSASQPDLLSVVVEPATLGSGDRPSFIRLDGLHIGGSSGTGSSGDTVRFQETDDCEIINCTVRSSTTQTSPPDPLDGKVGINVENSNRVKVNNNDCQYFHTGIRMLGNDVAECNENFVNHLAADGFKFSGDNYTIRDNEDGGFHHELEGGHMDFMQFNSIDTATIRGNVCLMQNVPNVQGLFANTSFTTSNLTIEQNIISTSQQNAVQLKTGSGNICRNNTVINIKQSNGPATIDIGSSGTSTGNFHSRHFGHTLGPTNYLVDQEDQDIYYPGLARFGTFPDVGITIDDLDNTTLPAGIGAATRISELLSNAPTLKPHRRPIRIGGGVRLLSGGIPLITG